MKVSKTLNSSLNQQLLLQRSYVASVTAGEMALILSNFHTLKKALLHKMTHLHFQMASHFGYKPRHAEVRVARHLSKYMGERDTKEIITFL